MQRIAKRSRFSPKLSAWCFPPGLNVSSGQMLPDIICSNPQSIRPILTCKGWQSDIGMSCFPDWNQMWPTGRFPLDFSIKTHQNQFAVRYWISVLQQLDTTRLHILLLSAAFHYFGLINIGKTSTAGRRDDPAPRTRIISRPQQEHEPTALIHRNAASCLTFSTSSFTFTTRQWCPKIDGLTHACMQAHSMYTPGRLQSLLGSVFTSSLTLSLLSMQLMPLSALGPVVHYSWDMWVTPLDVLDRRGAALQMLSSAIKIAYSWKRRLCICFFYSFRIHQSFQLLLVIFLFYWIFNSIASCYLWSLPWSHCLLSLSLICCHLFSILSSRWLVWIDNFSSHGRRCLLGRTMVVTPTAGLEPPLWEEEVHY